jgi:hypothetical protein
MPYLSKDIERLIKRNQQTSLVRRQYSCGIFQEYDPFEAMRQDTPDN